MKVVCISTEDYSIITVGKTYDATLTKESIIDFSSYGYYEIKTIPSGFAWYFPIRLFETVQQQREKKFKRICK